MNYIGDDIIWETAKFGGTKLVKTTLRFKGTSKELGKDIKETVNLSIYN